MNIGPNGLALLKAHEQCRLRAYKPTPADKWTIGWGHTRDVKENDVCTQAQADAWLVEDIAWAQDAVRHLVDVDINQNQFDALVCFTFNVGSLAFQKSTLLAFVNSYLFAKAANEFSKWIWQKGKVLNGLVARRDDERKLFLTPVGA